MAGGRRTAPALPARALGAAALVLGLVAVVCVAWSHAAGALPGERPLAEGAYDAAPDSVAAQAVILLGEVPVVAVTVAIATAGVLRAFGWPFALLVPAAAAPTVGAQLLKPALGPTDLYVELNRVPADWLEGNTPSGHAAYVAGVFGLLALLALGRRRTGLAVLAALPLAAIAPALVVTGSHLPGDVLAGVALGLCGACALLAVALALAAQGARRTT